MAGHVNPLAMLLGGMLRGTIQNAQFSAAGITAIESYAGGGGSGASYYQQMIVADGAVFFVPCLDSTDTYPKDIIRSVSGGPGVAGGAISETGIIATLGAGQYEFSATSQQVEWTNPLYTDSWMGDFSVGCWFNTTNSLTAETTWYGGAALVIADIVGVSNDWGLGIMGTGQPIWGTGSPDISIYGSSSYNDGNWHYAVGTYVSSTGALALYVDGVIIATGTGGTGGKPGHSTLWSGAYSYGFTGGVTCLEVYEYALTPSQVAGHYAVGAGQIGAVSVTDGITLVSPVTEIVVSGATISSSTPGKVTLIISGGGSGTYNITPDTHGATPSFVQNDEFEGSTLDTSGTRFTGAIAWTELNWSALGGTTTTDLYLGSLQFVSEVNTSSTRDPQLVVQALPSGSSTYVAKVAVDYNGGSGNLGGVILRESATGKMFEFSFFNGNNAAFFSRSSYTAITAVTSTYTPGVYDGGFTSTSGWLYIKIVLTGTTLAYLFSRNGLDYVSVLGAATFTTYFTTAPDQIGFVVESVSSSVGTILNADFLRRTA